MRNADRGVVARAPRLVATAATLSPGRRTPGDVAVGVEP